MPEPSPVHMQEPSSARPDPIAYATPAQRWRPLGLSLLLHGVLVLFLIVFGKSVSKSLSTEPERRGAIVLAVAPENQPDQYLDEQDSLVSDQVIDAEVSAAPAVEATPPPLNVAMTEPALPDLAGPPPIESRLLDATQMTRPQNDLPSAATKPHLLTEAEQKLIEADQRLLRARQPKGEPAALRLFGGGQMKGRSFVFLIDRSKSMGGDGLGVLSAARRELTAAVAELEPHHTFQIIGYHDESFAIRRQMLDATEENRKLIPGFIDQLAAFGATDHLVGLSAALVYEPDVVVLMTDGGYPELHDGQIKMLSGLSRRGTTIHCIQFGAGPLQIRTNFMTKLAKENQGTFRYINVNKWRKE